MWTFTSSGMAMPALIPPSVLAEARTPQIQEAVANGWELQVRGRVKAHLERWCELYMPEGTYSKVYSSPGLDYNTRFYTTREAYGESLKRQALDIDYVKFKSTAERFPGGKKYHDLLLKVWNASTMLGRPYTGTGTPRKRSKAKQQSFVGSTFFDDYDELPLRRRRKSIHDLTDAELEDEFYG